MKRAARPAPLALRPLAWCAAAFIAGVALHVTRIPLWASAAAAACAAWTLLAQRSRRWMPGRSARLLLAFAGTLGVLTLYHTLNGLSAGTALLVVMGSVKLLEARTRRDCFIVVGTALVLLLAACLQEQALPVAALYALHAWLCCAALAIAAHPRIAQTTRGSVLLAGQSLALALPLAVLLFLLFPRLSGSLWGLPHPRLAATGLGESMSPGSISELIESHEPAFRVWFEGVPPPPAQRYWRGPVLHHFDGFTWSRRPRPLLAPEPRLPLGPGYHYRMLLEASARPWWYALDVVDAAPEGRRVVLTYDQQLVGMEPVSETLSFRASSHPLTRALGALPQAERSEDTVLPRERNPRAAALAAQLRRKTRTDREFVSAVLEWLRTGGFTYSLTPPRLQLDAVDDFLFRTRTGFCGHYASAFVSLMRSGGIPAHVVTGYLGGEWNALGGYLLVRQNAAHAWAEVWLEGEGWTRVDPTAVVAPERLQKGIDELLPGALSETDRLLRLAWLAPLEQAWDAANAWWATRVLEFDSSTQQALLQRLGLERFGLTAFGWAIGGVLGLWLAILAWRIGTLPHPPAMDRLARSYRRLCARLARAGVPRASHAGPLDYAAQIAAARPDLAPELGPLLSRYAHLRYGADAADCAVREFERAAARVRITRSARGQNAPSRSRATRESRES